MISTKQNGYQPNSCGIENPVPPKTGSNIDFACYHKKQLVRFCKKFHKDCYRLIGQKMALRDEVEELKKENADLRAKYLQATDEGTSFAHLKSLERKNKQLEQQVEKLKADLNEANEELKDANEKVVHLACNQNKDLKHKLTKAKEIIKELARVEYADFTNGDYSNELSKVLERAEQFLKESENGKKI